VQPSKQPNTALSESVLRCWVQASNRKGEAAFPEKRKPGLNAEQDKIQRLKRELDIARQERDTLKKAVACLGQNSTRMELARFFAKESR